MGRRARPRLPIDSAWFRKQIEAGDMSQRQVARLLKMDASGMSRLLSGERRLQMEEANQLAVLFEQPATMIMARAGVEALELGPKGIAVKGAIDANGLLGKLPPGPGRRVPAPPEVPGDAVAYRVLAEGPCAGWVVYAGKFDKTIDPGCVGKLVVAELIDGKMFCRVLTAGFGRNKWNLTGFFGPNRPALEEVMLAKVAKVLWVKAGEG